MVKKTNGSGQDDKIVKLPTLAERDRIRRAKQAQEKTFRKAAQQPMINLSKIPPFTRAVVAAFILVHLVLAFSLSLPALYDVWNIFGFVPAAFTGVHPFTWETAVSPLTHLFIHGNWMHLFFNTTMALVMGMGFEKQYGTKAAIFFFFASGLMGALFYLVSFPFSDTPVVGGSAALCGWFGAMIVVFHQQRTGADGGRYGAWPIIGFWVLFFVVLGILSDGTMAWQAHVGGMLTGVGLLRLLQKGKLKFLF